MNDVIRSYQNWLETDRRLPQDSVIQFMGNLPFIFRQLNISRVDEIDTDKITNEWRFRRWEQTDEGIKLSESAQKEYFPALKSFLRYLEDTNYAVPEGLSEIIKLEDSPYQRLRGLNHAEVQALQSYISANLRSDNQCIAALLAQLVQDTGCSLSELLDLRVSQEGNLLPLLRGERCGSFYLQDGKLCIDVSPIGRNASSVALSDDCLSLLSLHIENRTHRNAFLFLHNSSHGVRRMTKRLAHGLVEKLLQRAGIRGPYGRMIDVLRATFFHKPDPEKDNTSGNTHTESVISYEEIDMAISPVTELENSFSHNPAESVLPFEEIERASSGEHSSVAARQAMVRKRLKEELWQQQEQARLLRSPAA